MSMQLQKPHIPAVLGMKSRLGFAARLGSGVAMALALMSTPVFAQDKAEKQSDNDGFNLQVATPYSDQSGFLNLSESLEGLSTTSIELPIESVGSQIFDIDATNLGCLAGEESCLTRNDKLDMRYSKSLTASIDTLLDIELTPKASMRFGDESSSAVVGALVRIGDDLKDNEEFKSNTWYMFAGADAEAVTYAPNSLGKVTDGNFHLQDRIIVGDTQAGVGYRIGDSADISLGYFRREVTSFGNERNLESTSYTEDAAALSFTWRR